MTKEEKVIMVINAYNTGQDISIIQSRFKCSKSWLYKWLKRYKENPSGPWYLEHSRKPKTIHYSTSEEENDAIIAARLSLESKPYSQRGAISIQYELRQQQAAVLPVWKINKILKRANLTHIAARDPSIVK